MVVLFLIFEEPLYCFPWWFYHFTLLPTVHKSSNFSASPLTLVIYLFLKVALLIAVKWYFIVVLICNSLVIREAEHVFIHLLVICVSSLKTGIFKSFALFLSFWPHWTACGMLVPWLGIKPAPSAVRAQSPNHWTAREFPWSTLLINSFPVPSLGFQAGKHNLFLHKHPAFWLQN